ncbi:MAG: CPBP family intramembrane glutamic endopeptidase [Pyrinomonadaceae bacterium]
MSKDLGIYSSSLRGFGTYWIPLEAVLLTLVGAGVVRLLLSTETWLGYLSLAFWVYLPFVALSLNKLSLSDYGLTLSGWRRGLAWFGLSVLIVLVPFVVIAQLLVTVLTKQPGGTGLALPGFAEVLYGLVLVVIPEEMFFRGFLQTRISTWTNSIGITSAVPAILFTAVLFTLAHLVVEPDLIRAGVILPGLVMGWLRHKSGGALAPIGFHWLANLAAYAVLAPT